MRRSLAGLLGVVRRLRWRIAAGAAIFASLLGLILQPHPLLVWNVSASAPRGLYAVVGAKQLARGDMVVARIPKAVRIIAARRAYLPLGVPLVKRVAGVAGDRVCASGNSVSINGRIVAVRRAVDVRGRPMPWWSGCVSLVEDDYFLLMSENSASFDGRYFGVSAAHDIVGKAVLLRQR